MALALRVVDMDGHIGELAGVGQGVVAGGGLARLTCREVRPTRAPVLRLVEESPPFLPAVEKECVLGRMSGHPGVPRGDRGGGVEAGAAAALGAGVSRAGRGALVLTRGPRGEDRPWA